MKHPKSVGKGSARKPGGASSSAAAAGSAGDRKSRWGSSSDNAPFDRPAAIPSDALISPPDCRPFHPSPAGPPPHRAGSPFRPHSPPSAAGSPPLPSYGFHNLDRRTAVLADGSVRSYFALPPDYSEPLVLERFLPRRLAGPNPGLRFSPDGFREPPPFARGGPPLQHDYWSSLGLDGPRGPPEAGLKRKFPEENEFARHRQHVQLYGNPHQIPLGDRSRSDFLGRAGGSSPMGRGLYDDQRLPKQAKLGEEGFNELPLRGRSESNDVVPVSRDADQQALKRAFLKFVKMINENPSLRNNFVENGKNGPLKCVVCDRSSKDFTDVHGLVMHTYNAQNADMHVDHLGLHKALCVLMGWNYAKAPENSKAYQALSADVVAANREDLILWPPAVIVHNTNSGRRNGRMEGFGNKDMDTKLKELGFAGGKSKSIYGKEGHTGVTVVKFANTQAGLNDAERLMEYFEKDDHGRKGWARVQASHSGEDDEKNPALVKVDEKTGEKKRIFYGYLATAADLEKVDNDTKKKAVIKSRRELDLSE